MCKHVRNTLAATQWHVRKWALNPFSCKCYHCSLERWDFNCVFPLAAANPGHYKPTSVHDRFNLSDWLFFFHLQAAFVLNKKQHSRLFNVLRDASKVWLTSQSICPKQSSQLLLCGKKKQKRSDSWTLQALCSPSNVQPFFRTLPSQSGNWFDFVKPGLNSPGVCLTPPAAIKLQTWWNSLAAAAVGFSFISDLSIGFQARTVCHCICPHCDSFYTTLLPCVASHVTNTWRFILDHLAFEKLGNSFQLLNCAVGIH